MKSAYQYLYVKGIIGGVLAFVVLLAATLAVPAFSQEEVEAGCSLTYFDPHCSPSGWLSFILGDVIIGLILAAFLHYLERKSNAKIDITTSKIEEILRQDKKARDRRTVFVCQSLKDGFGAALISIGLINMKLRTMEKDADASEQLKEQLEVLEKVIRDARIIVSMSVETLDPMLVDSMHKLFNQMEHLQLSSGTSTGLPGYGDMKDRMLMITERLNAEVKKIKNE